MDTCLAEYRLGDITSASFAGIAAANPVILLPLGSQEDHGPWSPMGDYLLADQLAARIAKAATAAGVPTFAAPALPFGVADYFGGTPGGLAISAGAFRTVLAELLEGLRGNGLTRIVILNGHGGNAPVIHEVTLDFKLRHDLVISSFYLWKIAGILMERRLGPGQARRFGHGAEPLLSLNLALRAAETSTAKAMMPAPAGSLLGLPVSDFGTLDFEGLPIGAPVAFDQVPGDAMESALPLASAALGAAVADDLVRLAARFVAHFARMG